MLNNQIENPKHVCADCGRTYQTQESLHRHRRNHSESINYVCETCKATFKRRDLLNRHCKLHTRPAQRTHRACLRCALRKMGCDTKNPCSGCLASGSLCVYRSSKGQITLSEQTVVSPKGSNEDRSGLEEKITEITTLEETSVQLYDEPSLLNAGSKLGWPELPHISEPSLPHDFADHVSELITNIRDASAVVSGMEGSRSDYTASGDDETSDPGRCTQYSSESRSDTSLPTSSAVQGHIDECYTESSQHGVRSEPQAKEIVENLVKDAFLWPEQHEQGNYGTLWSKSASEIEMAFGMPATNTNSHIFNHFLALYFQHFHAKWPVIWKRGVVRDELAPHLYLVMTAIGAAFDDDAAAVSYSAEMLKALAPRLLQCCFERQHTLDRVLALSQSLLLFQLALLYFGRADAFQFCHRISLSWLPVCRWFNLFDESRTSKVTTREGLIKLETRRRLGMTCLHIDSSVSALLGLQPLLRYDEIKLHLPVPDYIWLSEDEDDIEAYHKYSSKGGKSYMFASLVHSTLQSENSLPELQPNEMELVFHGLLHHVWNVSAPPTPQSRQHGGRSSAHVSESHRVTDDVGPGSKRRVSDATRALTRCRKALNKMSANAYTIPDRTGLLVSTHLHGMSVIWINVDIWCLYKLARGCCNMPNSLHPPSAAIDAYNWANSEAALTAVDTACYLWGRTTDELVVPEEIRADFNVITHLALVYSALIIWVFSSCRSDGIVISLDRYRTSTTQPHDENLILCVENKETLIGKFANLLSRIQHSQQNIRSSFAGYHIFITRLIRAPFPVLW